MASQTNSPPAVSSPLDRRRFLKWTASLSALALIPEGAGGQEVRPIRKEDLAGAEALMGLQFTDEEREMMVEEINSRLDLFRALREVELPETLAPAVHFDALLPGTELPSGPSRVRAAPVMEVEYGGDPQTLAFASVATLGWVLREGRISSVDLTRMYLARLKRFDPQLECVVTLTEELALEQARRADAELAAGLDRGPLHGVPWGAKDLLAVQGYRTTWGAKPYEEQRFEYDATVVRRLEEAGAVLVAKLTTGALAQGDVWFGGRTLNPWNLDEGARGSSAGPAAATAAGLVGFSIGTETLGSILSPSDRCGVTGLRPTFGRVSRWGAMALSWTMDKVGPICRTVEDCALVFDAIQGADGLDRTARDAHFSFDGGVGVGRLRVGYLAKAFQGESPTLDFDRKALDVLRGMGVELVPVSLPEDLPLNAIRVFVLDSEEGAAFDELTRTDRDALLVRQSVKARPDRLRKAHFIPGVEYLQANRARYLLMERMREEWEGVDVVVAPTRAPNLSTVTNLTGHPAIAVPNGFRENGTPVTISFLGQLFGEEKMLTLAHAYQQATGFHLEQPSAFATPSSAPWNG